jgi:hypothetical protein
LNVGVIHTPRKRAEITSGAANSASTSAKRAKADTKPTDFCLFRSSNHSYAAEARRGEFLITIKADVVDDHLAGLNAIHYLLKVIVFDLQSVMD